MQKLYLGRDDADLIRGKRILLMDDVISTGGSLHAMEELVKHGRRHRWSDRIAVLAEGAARLTARTSSISSVCCRCSTPTAR